VSAELEELYQGIILDQNRRPQNFRVMDDATAHAEGLNPMCGDQLAVWIKMEGDVVSDVSFKGQGCAISKASASLMTAAIKGKTREEAESIWQRFRSLVTGGTGTPEELKALGSLKAFSGVSKFPLRVKCATLGWHALQSALAGGDAVVSTEPAQ
jgi:nitrogen fixation NifU-like protein